MRALATAALFLLVVGGGANADSSRDRTLRGVPRPAAGTPDRCIDGATGISAPEEFDSLDAGEVALIVEAAARALEGSSATIAVVDRAGRPLALFRERNATPANDDLAAGVARSAAFFSHDMAPLSSRTVRFLSGIHFPPGIRNTASAALYGIENTNRGCDLNVRFHEGKFVPRASALNGLPCRSGETAGCGPGIVTGKILPNDQEPASVRAGGIPLYRIPPSGLIDVGRGRISNGNLVGAIGVIGHEGTPDRDEYAAVTGAFAALGSARGPIAPVPSFPLPEPGNVYIDGIRLPFLGDSQRLVFNESGLPTGARIPASASAGSLDGQFILTARDGGCAASGYLAGPSGGSKLSRDEVDSIVRRAITTAKRTRAAIRLPRNSYARMVIAVADTDGTILALHRMPDTTVFSIDVAVAKSRNVVWFSSGNPLVLNDLPGVPSRAAVQTRTIGFGSQPFFPSGIDSSVFDVREGPFYRSLFLPDLATPCTQGSQPRNANQNGVVFFAGSSPLYRGDVLVGGLGISGDGIEQDDYVSVLAAGEFLPAKGLWADRILLDGVRLPMFKYPRFPGGVTECRGGPCS